MYNRPASCSLQPMQYSGVGADDLFPVIIMSCALVSEANFFHPSRLISHTTLERTMTFGCGIRTGLHDNNNMCICVRDRFSSFSSTLGYSAIYIIHSYISVNRAQKPIFNFAVSKPLILFVFLWHLSSTLGVLQ